MTRVMIYAWLLLTVLTMHACMKDKGDYNYREVNKITINGIAEEYFVNLNKQVYIHPELDFTLDQAGDTGRYKYEWITDATSGYGIPPDTLSRSRDLDRLANPSLGCADYKVYYKVTDTITGIFTRKDFTLHVVTPAFEGWFLLCDMEDGTSRLDMISQQGEKDTLYKDILKQLGSTFPMNAPPAFVASGPVGFPPVYGLVGPLLGTTNTAAILGLDTLEYKKTYDLNTFFEGEKVKNFTGADVITRFSGGVLFAENNAYYLSGETIQVPVNHMDDAPALFKVSPFMATNSYGTSWMFFNMQTNSMVRFSDGGTCNSIPAGDLFDYAIDNNAPGGMDLVYMGGVTYNQTEDEVIAVFREKQTGTFHLARCRVDGTVQTYYKEIKGTDIGQAAHFAVSPEFGYLFYSVGSKIYEYDPSQQKSYLMKDYGNKQITMLKFNFFNFSDILNWQQLPQNYDKYSVLRKKLLVSTWEEGNPRTSGMLDIYNVPAVNQQITLYKSYTGTGKIVSIAFRER